LNFLKPLLRNGLALNTWRNVRSWLEIVWLNCRLDDVTLVPTIRKPFDVLAEGLSVPQSGGSRTPIELFSEGVQAWGHAEIAIFTGVFAVNASS